MRIKWYGHACFELESKDGVKVITDPFDEKVGYDIPNVEADIVTVSHSHYDHNNVAAIKGHHTTITESGSYNADDIGINGIPTYHDDEKGSKRGRNVIYCFDVDGIKVCHLGDLGHMLDSEDLEKIKGVDVLLIPVGGTYTVDSTQAAELVTEIEPKVTIPMHYQTEKLKFNLEPVENFTKKFNIVNKINTNILDVNEEVLSGEQKVIILNYE